MDIINLEDLPFYGKVDTKVKIVDIKKNEFTFIHRDKIAQYELTVKKPKDKSFKDERFRVGGKAVLNFEKSKLTKKTKLVVSYT